MSKTILVFLAAMIICSLSNPVEDIRAIVQKDQCGIDGLATLRPQMQNQIALLKQNQNNMQAKAKLLALIEDAKEVYDECNIQKKVQPVLGDAVKAAGTAFLLASNCSKDLGIILLIADTIIQNPSDKTNDIIVLIFLYILGKQGYNDCQQFIHFIL